MAHKLYIYIYICIYIYIYITIYIGYNLSIFTSIYICTQIDVSTHPNAIVTEINDKLCICI
jgi:hypothetical protein